jgi:hypothetical protein
MEANLPIKLRSEEREQVAESRVVRKHFNRCLRLKSQTALNNATRCVLVVFGKRYCPTIAASTRGSTRSMQVGLHV